MTTYCVILVIIVGEGDKLKIFAFYFFFFYLKNMEKVQTMSEKTQKNGNWSMPTPLYMGSEGFQIFL